MTKTQLFTQSAGSFIIEGLSDVTWATVSEIEAETPQGGEVFNPNTGLITFLKGPIRFNPITCTTLYSNPQVVRLNNFFNSNPTFGTVRSEITAVYQMGTLTWTLGGLEMASLVLPGLNKTSNDGAYVTCRFTYSSRTPI
ncbi:hypothetical protein [Moorena sp. SIO3A2]|uniref:hypothetical protein n=1 Tax=Moorena sp. SIO3A2 TaxID=2607841 RepID=UPI0013B60091|nr:hypothetical protein [Moorena sp. SIO3A2]NER90349.1 hypothetical protein [Moorena sp. SIO3A2]